jgi:site-specific DNA-methyltransferase (adenine-specific)
MNNDLMFSSNSNEWATPQDFFDKLDKEFHFTLDPCATDENAKCDKYYTIKEDGLKQSWKGHSVFCNPPYGKEIAAWVEKSYMESVGGCQVVMLIPARTDTKYWHEWIFGKAEIRFIKGRLKFGDSKNSAPFPSAIIIFKKGNVMNNENQHVYGLSV